MCKAFEEVRNEGYARGMQQGMQQGIQQGMQQGMQQGIQQGMQQGIQQGMQQEKFSNIKTLMETMSWNPLQAMNALKIPVEEQQSYEQLLKQ